MIVPFYLTTRSFEVLYLYKVPTAIISSVLASLALDYFIVVTSSSSEPWKHGENRFSWNLCTEIGKRARFEGRKVRRVCSRFIARRPSKKQQVAESPINTFKKDGLLDLMIRSNGACMSLSRPLAIKRCYIGCV